MKKYVVIALTSNGAVMINKSGGEKGYDTYKEAKEVADAHKNLGVPIYVCEDFCFLDKKGNIVPWSLGENVELVKD